MSAVARPARPEVASSASPAPIMVVVGAVIVVATLVWWLLEAPRTTSSAVASLIVRYDEPGWDGALVAPIMVGAAWTAGLVPLAVARMRWWVAVAASVVATGALVSASIQAVAGELATLGAQDIAAMPLPPHAITTWAAIVVAAVVAASIAASAARAVAVSRAIALALVAGYAVVAVELAGVAGGLESYGFAALTGASGLWLAARLWWQQDGSVRATP